MCLSGVTAWQALDLIEESMEDRAKIKYVFRDVRHIINMLVNKLNMFYPSVLV